MIISEAQFEVWTDFVQVDHEDLEIDKCVKSWDWAYNENRLWYVDSGNASDFSYHPVIPGDFVEDNDVHAYLITEQSHEGLDIEVDVWAEFTLHAYTANDVHVMGQTVKATNLDHAVILVAELAQIEKFGALHIAINEPDDYLEALEHDVTTHADLLNWIRAGRNHKDFW